jgi:Smg protein
MIDILVYLFENYFDFSLHPKPDALARKLSAVGFDKDEISQAIVWLSGLKDANIVEFCDTPRSLRIYTSEEQQKLDAGCLGFMHFLEAANVVTPTLRELIIERALLLKEFPVSLAKFKIIVLIVLWSRAQDLEPLIIEELLYDTGPELQH